MTIIERERILTDAARQYLHGKISYEELTAIRLAGVRDQHPRGSYAAHPAPTPLPVAVVQI
jgi:hypothetical protein